MKKEILIASIALLLIAAPAFAIPPANHGHGKSPESNIAVPSSSETSPSVTSGTQPTGSCDPNGPWKNHGEYVSCVAHLHQGGQTVSNAAKSQIGKKGNSISGIPSPTSVASPSATPESTSSSDLTSSASASSLNTTSSNDVVGKTVHGVAHILQQLLDFFKHMI